MEPRELPDTRILQSDQDAVLTCDFAPQLADGETLSDSSALFVDQANGQNYAPALLSEAQVQEDTKVAVRVGHPKPRHKYMLIWRATTSLDRAVSEELPIEAER